MSKNCPIAGADEKTPSVPYYFTWINNTNEGSTERQTLINLDFFKYMRDTYGMQISIYAWDAGNFDGSAQGYGNVNSEKFRAQYPEGYKNVVNKAKELGIRFGLWGGPDGFGNTAEEEKERVDFYVHLCRDYHFAAFKLDGVCGVLRPEKAATYARMIEECRKYSPDLLLFNHRLDFYEAQKYITTFLWNGEETYTDVFACNKITAMHNRAYAFSRGNVEDENGNLLRLAEDHGVCLSSSLDYFEDELIYQAFGRCLIAAPEIYGNPWFLKDQEFGRLARIYNLHARYSDILVNGFKLPEGFGPNAVSRGSDSIRFICTGNDTWETKNLILPLDETIGLKANGRVAVNLRHPYDKAFGVFKSGEQLSIELPPFRAVLIEIAAEKEAAPILLNCEYEVVKEDKSGVPLEIKILKSAGGDILLSNGGETQFFCSSEQTDINEQPPRYLGALTETTEDPENGEEIYEAAMFAVSNDSLEAQCIKRAGLSAIPEVNAARDAFFSQATYRLRGCEAAAMFDGKKDTFFDGQSRHYKNNILRIEGGCLRVDLGKTVYADSIEFEVFAINEPTAEIPEQIIPLFAEYAESLGEWNRSEKAEVSVAEENYAQSVVKFTVHTLYTANGKRLRISYPIKNRLRYIRIAQAMDRIYSMKVLCGGKEIALEEPRANNLQAHYTKKETKLLRSGEFVLPEYKPGSFIALGVNGEHGAEGVYCTAFVKGTLQGFERRAPSYRANNWEHFVCDDQAENNTFYFALPDGLAGETVKLYASFSTEQGNDCVCDVYLCDKHI
ncbi:MAG: hypothetical protein J1E34_05945 [Oscillospiraceae bacterium]|nr:hypothetical protein [Oscillospiraceae bacterium]